MNADRDIGQWNRFEITMKGDRLTVVLNGSDRHRERASCPGCPPGARSRCSTTATWKDGNWVSPPALVQFRDIAIRELP